MGASTRVYSLFRIEGAECLHWLLVRATRLGYSNASQSEEDAAENQASADRDALVIRYRELLLHPCASGHTNVLEGEMQALPSAEVLYGDQPIEALQLWVAETRFGRPWLALDAASDEETFWAEIRADDDTDGLAGLDPQPPARTLTVYFLPTPFEPRNIQCA